MHLQYISKVAAAKKLSAAYRPKSSDVFEEDDQMEEQIAALKRQVSELEAQVDAFDRAGSERWLSAFYQWYIAIYDKRKRESSANSMITLFRGGDGGIRTHVPAHHRQLDFESSSL